MAELKLKPCPFCGGKAEVEYGASGYNVYQIGCQNGECFAYAGWGDTPEEAAEAWNRRAKNNACACNTL